MYLRQKDGEYRLAASKGGPPDPLLGNTPQLFLNSEIQVRILNIMFYKSNELNYYNLCINIWYNMIYDL